MGNVKLPTLACDLTHADIKVMQAAANAELRTWEQQDVEREVNAMSGADIVAMRNRLEVERLRSERMAQACRTAQRAIGTALTKGIGG